MSSEPRPLTIEDVTPKLEPVPASITDPDRQEAWQACRHLYRAIDLWGKWIVELCETRVHLGDEFPHGHADPNVMAHLLEGCEVALEILDRGGHLNKAPEHYRLRSYPTLRLGWHDEYRSLDETQLDMRRQVSVVQHELESPASDRFSFVPPAEADDSGEDDEAALVELAELVNDPDWKPANEKVAELANLILQDAGESSQAQIARDLTGESDDDSRARSLLTQLRRERADLRDRKPN